MITHDSHNMIPNHLYYGFFNDPNTPNNLEDGK